MPNSTDFELMEAEAESLSDPLLCKVDMPLRATYHPLGFSVEIATNSHEVLEAAEESWGRFRAATFSEPPLQVRVGVLEGESSICPPVPVCRAQRNLLSMVADRDNFAVCDLDQRFAFAWLTQAAVQHRSYLRYHFLDAVTLVLLATSYATPLHAACVSYAGQGFLLCGDSGAGKTSLAYACARAGWTYTSDDASYLLQEREDRRVVGNAHQFRFRPLAVQLFPELKGNSLTPRASGKPSIEIPTDRMPNIAIASQCSIDHIVFLNRRDPHPPGLNPYPKEVARQWFNQTLYSMPEVRKAQTRAIDTLLSAEVWELRYSTFDYAIDQLESLARRSK